ncbi:hypothetical protein CPB85DRAFT_1214547 [Mucidula mucida]|nr:hypothetical protein CPB85DRAFT_1214547 [Mucidula mucida]
MDSVKTAYASLRAQVAQYPTEILAVSAFAVGGVSTFGGRRLYTRYFRRVQNADHLTPAMFAQKRWLKGVVTSVGDSDNFRLYHTPAFGWRWPLKVRRVPTITKDLQGQTIHVRIAGVDAPEAAHFGRPAQPYSEEALTWLRKKILGKTLYCQVIRRDQYSRVVAVVVSPPRILPGTFFSGKNLSLEMLKAGWVTTYEQAGAEYGNWGKEEYLRVEMEAKVARRGMWANGLSGESPAAYKKRHASLESETPSKSTKAKGRQRSRLQ